VDSGDYELVATVLSAAGAPDSDESNNVVRRVLHVPVATGGYRPGPSARVPFVEGLDRKAATRTLRAAGFATPVWYERARGQASDRVDLQWPEAGMVAPLATSPVLVLSAVRRVPDLTGLDLDQARERLTREGLGLVPGPLWIDRGVGHSDRSVLGQSPIPGSRIDAGSAVRLVISEPRPVWPFVIGGLLCLMGLMLGLTHYARAYWSTSRDLVWSGMGRLALAGSYGRLPEAVRPRRITLDSGSSEEHVTPLTTDDLSFVHRAREERQDVTWSSETEPPTLSIVVTTDPGSQEIRWHRMNDV
jgi:hypothetical protein